MPDPAKVVSASILASFTNFCPFDPILDHFWTELPQKKAKFQELGIQAELKLRTTFAKSGTMQKPQGDSNLGTLTKFIFFENFQFLANLGHFLAVLAPKMVTWGILLVKLATRVVISQYGTSRGRFTGPRDLCPVWPPAAALWLRGWGSPSTALSEAASRPSRLRQLYG